MAAKILLCVALCFTLTQVSLARPDEGYLRYGQEVEERQETPSACQESLQKAQQQLQEMIKLSDYVKAELIQIFLKGKDCLKSQDMMQCVKDMIKESAANLWGIESQFRITLSQLIESVSAAIKSCMGQGFVLLIQSILPLELEFVV